MEYWRIETVTKGKMPYTTFDFDHKVLSLIFGPDLMFKTRMNPYGGNLKS